MNDSRTRILSAGLILGAALLMAGCLMRATVNLTIGDLDQGTLAVQAWGLTARNGDSGEACYDHLSITPTRARPFVFAFPDGFPAPSREMTEAIVRAHLAPLQEPTDRPNSLVFHPQGASSALVFSLDEGRRVVNIWIYSCPFKFSSLLGFPDDHQRFAVPIRQKELVALFGAPDHQGRDFAILGSGCGCH